MEMKYYIGKYQKRFYFIDILKLLAITLIVNSHMEPTYGKYANLASGGAIGLALFFFCSGFTLNIIGGGNFWDYYRKRIQRIYPTVFAVVLAESILFGRQFDLFYVLLYGGGWFVSCIMVMYIVLFIIGKYGRMHLLKICVSYLALVLLMPLFFDFEESNFFFNGSANICARFQYFIYMLFGFCARFYIDKIQHINLGKMWLSVISVLSPCSFYAFLMIINHYPVLIKYSICATFPLIATLLSWTLLSASIDMGANKWSNSLYKCIKFISALSLEAYLCQVWLITDKYNYLFPFNILIIFIAIIAVSYVLKIVSNLFAQTFTNENYNFLKIIKIV